MIKKALLLLEDGTCWEGSSLGASGIAAGTVLFYIGMTGYQSILTNPSCAGYIMVMGYPMIGNYGINEEEHLSEEAQVKGCCIKETSLFYSNWQAKEGFCEFAERKGLVILNGIDTQAIIRHLRIYGSMRGVIGTGDKNRATLRQTLLSSPSEPPPAPLRKVERLGKKEAPWKVAVIDAGIDRQSIGILQNHGFYVTLFPWNTPSSDLLSSRPHGIIIAGGPRNTEMISTLAATLNNLYGTIPILGLGVGFEAACLSLGATSQKLPAGHFSQNQPVIHRQSKRCITTIQNHLYTIEPSFLPGVDITYRNLNDNTPEGIACNQINLTALHFSLASDTAIIAEFMEKMDA
jgi:carbamoyl-phosphate synthase small subunit